MARRSRVLDAHAVCSSGADPLASRPSSPTRMGPVQRLAWIQHPVPASKVATSLKCTKPNDISGHACPTYVADCVFGSWSSRLCRCVCLDEGRRGGYCRDHSTGECSRLC